MLLSYIVHVGSALLFCKFSKGLVFAIAVCAFFVAPLSTSAENAAFDLVGPKIDVRVGRDGQTRPIAEVPNLQAGDRVWIHPDLPDSQSVHYLMVVAFLRGATNPPPENWFTRAETWNKPVRDEGIFVTVPAEADEALIFLAPETGGAFSTLRNAVRGKPGAFVRAAQDLEQASLDRSRLEAYLQAVKVTSVIDPEDLQVRTTMLARSLNVKLDKQCFDKPSAEQVPCLTQNNEALVLDDAHSQNMVATLTNGAPTDLLAQLSSTPTARSGYYSPYIGAVVDVVRILGTAHSAQYQYIPALAQPKQDTLNLRLNNPPSFRNPKSVLVIALPPVRSAVGPPLRALDAGQVFCANKPDLVLPADGAPLVFSTELAHNFVLHVENKSGAAGLPAKPDPSRGGFVIDTQSMAAHHWQGELTGVIRGTWGFRPFEGPHFRLRSSRPGQWVVASKDASALIVGREDTLHIQSAETCCVSDVLVDDENGKMTPVPWKANSSEKPEELEVRVPLQKASAGSVKILVKQFGVQEADEIALHTYAEAGRLDSFSINSGDLAGVLRGTRLDQVEKLEVNGFNFKPGGLARANQHDELKLTTADAAAAAKLTAGEAITAHISLKDGRTLQLNSTVEPSRPRLSLISKSVQNDTGDSEPIIHLGSPDELPQDGRLNFFLKMQVPETFSPGERVEVATSDESFHVLLSVKDGNLTMQDSKTIFAVLDPMKLLGPSAFGPLKFRPVSTEGSEGDWQPLINLVRIPELKGIRCVPATKSEKEADGRNSPEKTVEKDCNLSGDKLFLIDAVSAEPDFSNPVTVPDGFVEEALAVPSPKNKTLYIKLRDDPATVNTAVLPILNSQP
jgi:hypothetical protein